MGKGQGAKKEVGFGHESVKRNSFQGVGPLPGQGKLPPIKAATQHSQRISRPAPGRGGDKLSDERIKQDEQGQIGQPQSKMPGSNGRYPQPARQMT